MLPHQGSLILGSVLHLPSSNCPRKTAYGFFHTMKEWVLLIFHKTIWIEHYVPCGSTVKRIHQQCGRPGSIPGMRRCPGEGKGYPLQYAGLENSMDCIVHEVAKSQTIAERLSLHHHFTCVRIINVIQGKSICPVFLILLGVEWEIGSGVSVLQRQLCRET